jgi:maleylacetate reductase
MIVRWGLDSLGEVLEELSVSAPLLITEALWQETELPVARRFHGARPHAEITGVREATALAQEADGLVALGGGSVMDTTKAVSVLTGLPMISIPTTYAGAEWTPFFGVRNEQTRTKDAGFDARVEGIVYEPKLTLRMPPPVTAGTALNALTHCAEALYVPGRNGESDEHALAGAGLIARHLPAVLENGKDLDARTEELAAIALETRLRDYDIPRDDLGELSAATAQRGAAKANPRTASVDEIRALFEAVW